jgi:hypothetical protein
MHTEICNNCSSTATVGLWTWLSVTLFVHCLSYFGGRYSISWYSCSEYSLKFNFFLISFILHQFWGEHDCESDLLREDDMIKSFPIFLDAKWYEAVKILCDAFSLPLSHPPILYALGCKFSERWIPLECHVMGHVLVWNYVLTSIYFEYLLGCSSNLMCKIS